MPHLLHMCVNFFLCIPWLTALFIFFLCIHQLAALFIFFLCVPQLAALFIFIFFLCAPQPAALFIFFLCVLRLAALFIFFLCIPQLAELFIFFFMCSSACCTIHFASSAVFLCSLIEKYVSEVSEDTLERGKLGKFGFSWQYFDFHFVE